MQKIIVVNCPKCGEEIRTSADFNGGSSYLDLKESILREHRCGSKSLQK